MHLLGGAFDTSAPPPSPARDEFAAGPASKEVTTSMADRIAALEARVARLEERLGGTDG